jgi:hypothetical protein
MTTWPLNPFSSAALAGGSTWMLAFGVPSPADGLASGRAASPELQALRIDSERIPATNSDLGFLFCTFNIYSFYAAQNELLPLLGQLYYEVSFLGEDYQVVNNC